ncbi:tRNA1(Val) (adenine(37)-N6)-methyltransferase [Pseudochryseolinea flava]|uniref:tRNA1(Val) (adenine(37)-N6)-methyltransferase n=1 Tax=Pseudochryseolinea flava TaxID=2059302 RepID=A0A364XYA5_9BACT|nr:methyltransferase [Pseudochryseolinea flava]RAV98563.1 tRNA (adenosine(37)-N6)-methyltransferase TrmM [Pseudochryseolinea flava]
MSRSASHFHFKQFSIRHDQSTMKVGTDGVLLGAWADVNDVKSILDIGTGSGVIALMLAQRSATDAFIDAVEIESADTLQARENVSLSRWPKKVHVVQSPIQDFYPGIQYDLIVSNPPYFNNSQIPPDARRVEARHTTLLSHDAMLQAVARLLKPSGHFSVILPYTEGHQCIALALRHDLYCVKQWNFRTRADKPIERLLLTFSLQMTAVDHGEILLYNGDNDWSSEYRALTRDFYLKL